MSAPQIVGYDPDPDFAGYDDEDGTATGYFRYDDGTKQYGRLPAELVADLVKPKPATPAEPNPGSYEAFEAKQIERERAGKPLTIEIPKTSRIAYVHNNPGNLKYVGQEGAHQGEPAEDGGYWAAFETPEAGYAALQHQVKVDTDRGLSLGQFVTKYAPPGSNDTAGYIASAARALGGSPDTPISTINPERLARFMAQHESGTNVGGVTPDEQPGSAAPAPMVPGGYPGSVAGLPAAEAQVSGSPLTRSELEQRQQAERDRAQQNVQAVQQAAAARIEGRNEALAAVAANYQDQQQNAQRQLAEQQAIKAEAASNIQQQQAVQLDPGRLFRQMSGGSVLLGLFAVALSAAGQTLQQRAGVNAPNLGLSMMTKAIDDDIEDQKQNKQSRLAYWTRVYGNAEQGILAAKKEIYDAGAAHLAAKAQTMVQNADIQAGALAQAQELKAQGDAAAAKLQQIEEQKLQIRYAAPKPVVVGDPAKQLKTLLQVDKALESSGYTKEQRAQLLQGAGLPAPQGESAHEQHTREAQEKYNEDQGKAEGAMTGIGDLARKAGLVRDPSTGLWHTGDGVMPPALSEKMKSLWGLNPWADRPIAAAAYAAKQAMARFLTGATMRSDEEGQFDELIGVNTTTREQLAERLNAAEGLIRNRRPTELRKQGSAAPEAWK